MRRLLTLLADLAFGKPDLTNLTTPRTIAMPTDIGPIDVMAALGDGPPGPAHLVAVEPINAGDPVEIDSTGTMVRRLRT